MVCASCTATLIAEGGRLFKGCSWSLNCSEEDLVLLLFESPFLLPREESVSSLVGAGAASVPDDDPLSVSRERCSLGALRASLYDDLFIGAVSFALLPL